MKTPHGHNLRSGLNQAHRSCEVAAAPLCCPILVSIFKHLHSELGQRLGFKQAEIGGRTFHHPDSDHSSVQNLPSSHSGFFDISEMNLPTIGDQVLSNQDPGT